ncbi:MAG: P-loop NTPase [Candidatus Nezhaarchaeota archaeon]|nr:P-loop NTPase [Candidatus Nezhaarchaeota archaeon]
MRIAISGKGGCGKSTITTLLSRAFLHLGFKVTVLDADESNIGLTRMLGLNDVRSIAEAYGGRRGLKRVLNEGIRSLLNIEIIGASRDDVRVIRIGKIERGGEGCACPFGVLAKEVLSSIKSSEKEVILVDMDAGIEHFGRGIDQAVDAILFVVDPTFDSIMLAERASRMARDLGVAKFMAVLNKVDEESSSILKGELSKMGVKIVGRIRYDPEIMRATLLGLPITSSMAMADAIELAKAIIKELGVA